MQNMTSLGRSWADFSLAGDNLGAQTGSNYGVINVGATRPQSASILQTLYLTNPKYDLQEILRVKGRVLDGTCEWILDHPDFLSWLTAESSELLRLVGGPGVGKTMISTFLVANIEPRKNKDVLVAYYFCDGQKELRRTSLAVLRSLIIQILQQRPDLQRFVLPDFEIMGDTIRENIQALWNFILEVSTCETVRELILLVDAIDELSAESQIELATMLQHLFESTIPEHQQLKIVITHRPDTILGDQLAGVSHQIDINAKSTGHDIQKFIGKRISHLITTRGYSPSLSHEVRNAMRDNTKGTFLWASLILDDLETIWMNDKVKQRLQMIPKSLDAIYSRILSGIHVDDVGRSALILQYVTAAQRPLTRIEIATICYLAERMDNGSQLQKLPSRDQIQDLTNCYRCCGALLYLDRSTDTVNLTHQSVKDYFTSPHIIQNPALRHYSLSLKKANLAFFNVLVQYLYDTWLSLEIGEFDHTFRSYLPFAAESLVKGRINSLMQYAVTQYCHHAMSVSDYSKLGPFSSDIVSDCPIIFAYMLYHAVMTNDLELTKHLLSLEIDLKMCFQDGRTALHVAAERSHFVLAKLLLDRGHPAVQRDFDGQTALHLAVSARLPGVIELLGVYENGLLLNMRDYRGRTPLHLAVQSAIWTKDEGELALLLLNLGADPSIKSFANQTPLEELLQALEGFQGSSKGRVLGKSMLAENVYGILKVQDLEYSTDVTIDARCSAASMDYDKDDDLKDYETDVGGALEPPDGLTVYRYIIDGEREEIAGLTQLEKRRTAELWHSYIISITQLLSGVRRRLDARSFLNIVPREWVSLSEHKILYEQYMNFTKNYCINQGKFVEAQADDNLLTFLVREWSRFSHAIKQTNVLLKSVDTRFVRRVYTWSGRHPETTYQLAQRYWWQHVGEPTKIKLAAITDAQIEGLIRAQVFSIDDLKGLHFATRGAVRFPDNFNCFELYGYRFFGKEVARGPDSNRGEAYGALSLQAPRRLSIHTPRESESMFN